MNTAVPPVTPDVSTETKPVEESPLVHIGQYARALQPHLPAEIFKPNTKRLFWMVGYIIVAAALLLSIKSLGLIWPLKLVLGVLAGICFGALGFIAHEILHGSVIENRTAQDALGFFGFMPFFISPTFWRYWHNRLHHGHTQALIVDPDAFPPLKLFKHSKFIQAMFPFTPGSGHKRSYSYFAFWFSFHVFVAQTYLRFRNKLYDELNHTRSTVEFLGQIIIWSAVLVALGPENLIFTFVIPFITMNYFVMSYIATNHNLSPMTKVNDPLVNSLTVTNHSWMEPLHLNFGYHVEHHIFPRVSGAHAKKIHALLKSKYPEKFQVMPKLEAMKRLYTTARIYKNSTTLVNPETGTTYPTLGNTL